jgi:O-acetyl-ADP-ribose deacetylase (regulator of RNase III)
MRTPPSRYEANGFKIEVYVGAITKLPRRVGAIVSSDDNYLSAGGGVSAAIRRAAGDPSIETRAKAMLDKDGRSILRVGSIFVTPAGNLNAERIVHAVVIDLDRGITPDVTIVRTAVSAALEEAADLASIALPLLGSGAGGLATEDSAMSIADEIVEFAFLSRSCLREALLVVLDETGGEALRRAVERAIFQISDRKRRAEETALALFGRSLDALRDPEQRLPTLLWLFAHLFSALPTLTGSPTATSMTTLAWIERWRDSRDPKLESFMTQLGGRDESLRLLRHLVGERNRIVHGAGTEAIKVHHLVRDIERLIAALPVDRRTEPLSVPDRRETLPGEANVSAVAEAASAYATAHGGSPHDQRDQSLADGSSSVSRTIDDEVPDDPTVRLAAFLRDHLTSEQRDYLDTVFQSAGYIGDFDLKLVEYCLERDPVDTLREMFARPTLLTLCTELTRQPRTDLLRSPDQELAQKILGSLGFAAIGRPEGIIHARTRIERAHNKLETAGDTTAIRGAIVEGAQTFERIASDLLTLYAIVLFGQPWPNELRSRKLLDEDATPDRLSLGSVIDALVRFDRFLAQRKEILPWTRWQELVQGRPLLGDVGASAQQVTKVRNDVAHYRAHIERMNSQELRALGSEMFNRVLLPVVRHIEGEGVYPRIIAVREYVRDAYGRRFVKAEDDRGEQHKIFTTEDLDPSLTYFMFPRTNPARIYPLLIARATPGAVRSGD